MLEQCIKALLADENLPEVQVRSAAQQLLDTFRKHSANISIAECWWHFFDAPKDSLCAGPIAKARSKTIRVTRIVNLSRYLSGYVDRLSLAKNNLLWRFDSNNIPPANCEEIVKRGILLDNENLQHPRRLAWSALASETRGLNASQICDELAMVGIECGTPLVAIDYDVPTNLLHVPTVLDAGLQPFFIAKPGSEQPRAWNWARSTWGLTEYVHQPRIPLINPSVRFIGKVAGNPAQIPTSTKKLVLSPGHQMEVFLEGVLRQVSAHVELGAFIAGTKEILQLSPYEFEHFVAALYARAGFKTLVTKASGDGGIDVIAVFPTDATDGLLIQAKRYSGGVGISVIRELIGARHLASADRKLYRLAVITTGRFTKASKAAELSHAAEIELYDYRALADILQSLRTTRFSDIYYLQATSAADLC